MRSLLSFLQKSPIANKNHCIQIFLFNFQVRKGFIICPNPGKKTDINNKIWILKKFFLWSKNILNVSKIIIIIEDNTNKADIGKKYEFSKLILICNILRIKIFTNNSNREIDGIVLIKRLRLLLHGNLVKILIDSVP